MTGVPAPTTYAEWLPLIERFRDGDDGVVEAMHAGTIEWTNVVAERWTARLAEAFAERLKKVSSLLQLALDRAHGDPFAVSQAMLAARRSVTVLHRAADLPSAPEMVRQHFLDEVTRFATQTQGSLETSARQNRADALLKALRDNPLPAAVTRATAPDKAVDSQLPGERVRRILL